MKLHVLLIDLSFLAAQDRFHFGLPPAGFRKGRHYAHGERRRQPARYGKRRTVAILHRRFWQKLHVNWHNRHALQR
jgi:hypothetical protein